MQSPQCDYHPGSNERPAHIGNLHVVTPTQAPPTQPAPKNVAFELLLDENSKVRARIPMRVQIYPHDTTDSIVTTVKNFYGIYDGAANGVSFEDEHGTTLIARYENLRNNMTVYVRVIPSQAYPEVFEDRYYNTIPYESRKLPALGEPFQMAPVSQPAPVLEHGQTLSRPASRATRKRSVSPFGRDRRSASQNKHISKGSSKNKGSSISGVLYDDASLVYSDSDGDYGSVTGTRGPRSEQQFASSDISMENILQDGRRKRPKFESSELPLFVPPQVPVAISPQRRQAGQEIAVSPFARPMQPYPCHQPLPSPQSGYNEHSYGAGSGRSSIYATPVAPEHGHRVRGHTSTLPSGQFNGAASRTNGAGVLPTPDPTIASCISDEDVAMQLIRLGDASNFSHGRTSASTLDDAFSSAADAASSTGATSDGDDASEADDDLPNVEETTMLPPAGRKRQMKQLDGDLHGFGDSNASDESMDEEYTRRELKDDWTGEVDEFASKNAPKPKRPKTRVDGMGATKVRGPKLVTSKQSRGTRNSSVSGFRRTKGISAPVHQKIAAASQLACPASKASTSSASHQHPLAAGEEDLSTKPRCQRCRKSKKGCDRQRPCGRCKDAGIGLEGCISEDEGNGRKGRYGRHMGVPVKKILGSSGAVDEKQPATDALATTAADKNKKRKR